MHPILVFCQNRNGNARIENDFLYLAFGITQNREFMLPGEFFGDFLQCIRNYVYILLNSHRVLLRNENYIVVTVQVYMIANCPTCSQWL